MLKKLFLVTVLLAALLPGAAGKDYDYKPRESWPYLKEDFTQGTVRTSGGTILSEGLLNVSVVDGSLHYISDGVIMAADMRQVYLVKIGDEIYINRLGKLMRVLHEEPGGYYLIREVLVDREELAKSDIGYGVNSAVASTQRLSTLGMEGHGTLNMDLTTAINQAKTGPVLPLLETLYFLTGSRQTEASKRDFLEMPGLDKDEAKAFLKKEKIKFNKEGDLVKVLLFLVENNIH